MSSDSRTDVGKSVNCSVCDLRKKPIGRDASVYEAGSLCDSECPGYYLQPHASDLWPGETREEFGYTKPESSQ